MSTGFNRWRMLLDKVLQLRAQVRVVASVVLDQINDPVDDRLQPVDREESIFAVLLDLIVIKLLCIVHGQDIIVFHRTAFANEKNSIGVADLRFCNYQK